MRHNYSLRGDLNYTNNCSRSHGTPPGSDPSLPLLAAASAASDSGKDDDRGHLHNDHGLLGDLHDNHGLLGDPQTPHSLGKVLSSLSNSWESSPKPMKLVGSGEKQASTVNADLSTPDVLTQQSLHQPSVHDTFLKSYKNEHHRMLSPLSKPNPSLNQQATPTQATPTHGQATPLSPLSSKGQTTAIPLATDSKLASMMEHKRQVSVAVDYYHSDKRRKKSKQKQLYTEDHVRVAVEENFIPREISKQTSAESVPMVRSIGHTPFIAGPHQVAGSELGNYSNDNSNSTNSYANSYNYAKNGSSSKNLFGQRQLSNAVVGVARGVVTPDEDHEYFSELVDNLNKKCRHLPSVSRSLSLSSSTKPSSRKTAGSDKGLSSVNMAFTTVSSNPHDQSRPSTTYSFRKPRPLSFRSHSRNL